jgi:2-polyprenyl-3-methyl-5-hydroxy-6-metoxy-1,4-benzoquinol methylase
MRELMQKESIYSIKEAKYFQGARDDVVGLLPTAPNRVLELGCGAGRTLMNARQQGKASEIVGVDIIDRCAEHNMLDRYIQTDADSLAVPYPFGYFDVIICADVLEHLVDPWQTVAHLRNYLKVGGMLVASIPNARNYIMLTTLMFQGDFCYRDEGLFDRGHLRFFCRKNIMELFTANGFILEPFRFRLEKVRKLFNLATCGLFSEFMVKQYLVIARKTSN